VRSCGLSLSSEPAEKKICTRRCTPTVIGTLRKGAADIGEPGTGVANSIRVHLRSSAVQ
jgi:hypothetical protein